MTETRTCPQCERSFEPNAKHQIYDVEACRYQGWIQKEVEAAEASAQRVEVHDLDEVRGRAEESKEKARYTLIAREHITHTLVATGYFSAEDFDALGIPAEHVNVCTSWIGNFSRRKLMEPISWRASSKPSRKGGKVWTYKITEKGRAELPALLEDTRREIDGVSAGRPSSKEGDGLGKAGKEAGTHSGDAGSLISGRGAGEAESKEPPGRSPCRPDIASTASPDKPLTGVDGGETRRTVETTADSGDSVHSGEDLAGGRGQAASTSPRPADAASGEILTLLPEPDPESWAA
ncbi:MAG TPA: hypothetical protein VI039_13050 [Solirubrobacterales bacterium]